MKHGRLAIIMLGPPGAGKGTQARMMSESLHIPHISTGDILREALRNETELGKKAKSFMDTGALVPDALVDAIVEERLGRADCNRGFILDGYPRTIPQAEFLRSILRDDGTEIRTIGIEAGDSELVRRLSSRWSCPKCGKIFNSALDQGKAGGRCDSCNAALVQRKDDNTGVVEERLRVYKEQTEPLVRYYKDRGEYTEVNGDRPVKQIFNSIMREVTNYELRIETGAPRTIRNS
jgi:adenylate kinase